MEYDRFAEIYGVWTDTAASARANLEFYLSQYASAHGAVVELGVGDGRIAVEAARRGRDMIGVDLSRPMLARCRDRAEQAGVLPRMTLIEGDFRSFTLPVPAGLIALPYHSLGHLTTLEAKRDALRHIHSQLADGGRFIFDDFQMTPARVHAMRRVQLRAAYEREGADALLWVTSLVDEAAQAMRVVTWEDRLDATGILQQRQYRPLSLSWMTVTQARALLEETGFTIEACYGDFSGTAFDPAVADEQVWIARKGRVS
ncbi:MAG: class I SAM-dependent methyltransferase [Alphaproteobacteria bacterium]